MKSMLKVMLILALAFASTFLLLNATGLLTVERIQSWLSAAQNISPMIIGIVVMLLLFADLFVAMPTLTIMLLSGFFLGPVIGASCSVAGLIMAGFTGYTLSYRYGDRLLAFLVRDPVERENATRTYETHGVATILLSRAVPILPEVSACMAGLTRMKIGKFALTWLVSTVPYAAIAAYAGSISTVSNPMPAIYTAIGLTVFFWAGWFVLRNRVTNNHIQ